MLTIEQTLLDYPVPLLRAIAEVRGIPLHAASQPELVADLSRELADPSGVIETVEGCPVEAQVALNGLVAAGGQLTSPAFARLAGEVRQGGPGWLTREQPWLAPVSAAEVLWYRGLIGRGFATVDGETAEYVYVPRDILPWLPSATPGRRRLHVAEAGTPQASRRANNDLVLDACTLLAVVQSGTVRVDHAGHWRRRSLEELNRQLREPHPEAQPDLAGQPESGDRLSYLVALSMSAGWLRAEGDEIRLDTAAVRPWLNLTGSQQQQYLWTTWLESTRWNDLWRTPALRCEGSGWHNDAVGTRQRLVADLADLRGLTWYGIEALIAAIHSHDPDFQRADGVYTTWYVRRPEETTYLLGFEHWDDVEGELIRYLLTGPLHWLGALDLGAGRPDVVPDRMRLSATGAAWLHHRPLPASPAAAPIQVAPDFSVLVPAETSALERFRVARFTMWEASRPDYRYRITQTALRRAATEGVTPSRVLAFLRHASREPLPANVERALERLTLAGHEE